MAVERFAFFCLMTVMTSLFFFGVHASVATSQVSFQGSSAVSNGITQWTTDGQSQFGFSTQDGLLCQSDGSLSWNCQQNGAAMTELPVSALPIGVLNCNNPLVPQVSASASASVPVGSESPNPIDTPLPNATSVSVNTPALHSTPVPGDTPVPDATPVPSDTPVPDATPVPVSSPVPDATPVPNPTPTPDATPPVPSDTPAPDATPVPSETPVPNPSPLPSDTPSVTEPTSVSIPGPAATTWQAPDIRIISPAGLSITPSGVIIIGPETGPEASATPP